MKHKAPRVVLSVPRLLAYLLVTGILIGGARYAASTPPHTSSIQTQNASNRKSVAATPSTPPTSTTAQTTLPTSIPAVPPPKPTTLAVVPHSATPAPVVRPDPNASVNGLTPVDAIPPPVTTDTTGTDGNTSTQGSTPATTTSYLSTNWAGYLATTGHYTSVSGSWNVPNATGVAGRTSADTAWIGIGGVTSDDLIQVGTIDSVSTSGKQTSFAFYELLPQSAHTITSLPVSPDDSMQASIAETSADHWNVTITDNTTGNSFTTALAYTSSYSSVEWIEEDPSNVFGHLVAFDVFAPVTFTGGGATDNGNSMTILSGNAQPVTLVSAAQQPLAVPSALGSDGQSFTVTRH